MKQHWYAYSFLGQGNTYSSTYVGYEDNNITMPRIRAAKVFAGVSPDAVVLSVSYLGRMTRAQMEPDE